MANAINNAAGFPPIADPQARILILGSMPSVKSLQQQQYYAHPRNAFWPVMGRLFNFDCHRDYHFRCQQLINNHIALWDCIQSCRRKGSLDQHIETDSIITNDIDSFLQQHPRITHIFFNGTKARQLFSRYIAPQLGSQTDKIERVRLPSTSPAHAAMTFEQKVTAWQAVKSVLRNESLYYPGTSRR